MGLVLHYFTLELSGQMALMRLFPPLLELLGLGCELLFRLLVLDLVKVLGLRAETMVQHVVALKFVGQAFLLIPHVLIHYALVGLLVLNSHKGINYKNVNLRFWSCCP